MKLSEYIALLQDLEKEHGDIDVYRQNFGSAIMGACQSAPRPEIKCLKIPTRREHVLRYHYPILDTPVSAGVKVVSV